MIHAFAVDTVSRSRDPDKRRRRGTNRDKATYRRGSYTFQSSTFDGLPALKRRRGDGALEIFYQEGGVDLNDHRHGHAVIRNGKLVYKRRPGEENPVVNRL